jgi:putative tributyrin esterase
MTTRSLVTFASISWFSLAIGAAARAQTPAPAGPPKAPAATPSKEEKKPAAGHMIFGTFPSESMHAERNYGIYLPAGYEEETEKYPVIYFLHGLFEDEHRFDREGRGGREVLDKLIADGTIGKVLVAIPRGDLSFYMDSKDGTKPYEKMVIDDFVSFVEKNYRVKPGPENRGISGVSMGGLGSLKIAFRHPDRFGSVSAHSAALLAPDVDKLPDYTQRFLGFAPVKKAVTEIFGDPIDPTIWRDNNPFYLLETRTDLAGIKLYFDCGDQDRYQFNKGAEELHELLDKKKIPHEFHILPGGHGWDYLGQYLHQSIEFHWRAFTSKGSTSTPPKQGK